MSKWQECQLGDMIRFKRGYDLPHRERAEGKFPIISSSGISGFHKIAKVKGPGVVTGRYGTIGEVFYISEDFWPLNTSLYVQDFKGNYPRYISYFLKILDLGSQNVAGAVPGVNRNALHKLMVRKPALPVQRKIAAVLSAYDDLIENNTRRIVLLEKMAEEIYREWFVRLRFPGHEQTTFHKGIPEGWSVEKIGSFSQEIRTGVKVKDLDSSTKYLGLEHLPRKSILVREFSTIDSVQSDKLLFNNGYILFGKIRPYLHKVALAYFSGACSSDTIVIRPKYRYCEGFLLFTIFSNTFIELATISSKGTKMPRADWNFLEKLEIVLPSQKILEEYQEKFEIYFSLMSNLSRINEKLQQTRDRLLSRLISGKLSLEDLDIQFPPSMIDSPSPAQGQA